MPSMESFAARQPRQMMLLLGPSALISMPIVDRGKNKPDSLNPVSHVPYLLGTDMRRMRGLRESSRLVLSEFTQPNLLSFFAFLCGFLLSKT